MKQDISELCRLPDKKKEPPKNLFFNIISLLVMPSTAYKIATTKPMTKKIYF